MVKLLIGLLEYLRVCAPLLISLIILTVLCVLLSKSIKKHYKIFYTLLAIPFLLVVIPSIGNMFGLEMPSLVTIPFLGEIIRDYIHMGTLGHPLLIIIMYMGALDLKRPNVKKLMSIRKELSIVSGFAVFAHSWIRVINNIPSSFKFFSNNTEYMAETKVASELGAGISSFSFLLGVIMLIIFIPLWVTSFDAVHKKMGHVKWKKLQKWSYVLYATLFIHAMGIQIGGMLNPRGGNARPATVQTTAQAAPAAARGETAQPIAAAEAQSARGSESGRPSSGSISERNEAGGRPATGGTQAAQVASRSGAQATQTARPASGGRMPTKSFADFPVSAQAKRYINMFSLILIYGSYLFLRIRKSKRDAQRRSKAAKANG